jgi:nucleotide-binding universal stress UspA family protein
MAMSSTFEPLQDRPFVLMLGLDLTDQESSGFAFDQAARIVARIPNSQLHVAYILGEHATREEGHEALGLLELYVSEKGAALGTMDHQSTGVHVRVGDPGREIAQIAADLHADMIVVGTRRPAALRSLVVGSTAGRVMATAQCPVFVAGPRPKPEPSHFIVIDPPCPDCVQTRLATTGATWWCERHSESHHLRKHHIYSYHRELSFRQHDSEVTATGVD